MNFKHQISYHLLATLLDANDPSGLMRRLKTKKQNHLLSMNSLIQFGIFDLSAGFFFSSSKISFLYPPDERNLDFLLLMIFLCESFEK